MEELTIVRAQTSLIEEAILLKAKTALTIILTEDQAAVLCLQTEATTTAATATHQEATLLAHHVQ